MKAKHEFTSEESYREYLLAYYVSSCLYALNHSGGLGGQYLSVAALRMAKGLVDMVVPISHSEKNYSPKNPEHEEDLS
jgi:hypothetical protein